MNNNSKTFRLFISSTFSDFQVEREALQTKIFPEIKEYCSSEGYTFQPIDLRWGVSNEAQLDQKALEMCIKEVQSCKTHDYPNFLIMLGDRYGWVPLPNIIEKDEFELISKNITLEDKELLLDWYYVDKNQIPVSYILKQRTDEYKDYDFWIKVESKLRDVFQNAIENLDDDIKNKYNTSATESEAIEGIISYFTKTEYQKKLLDLVPELGQLDHKHIFGFFRHLDKNTAINDKFISDDYEKAQEFKDKAKKHLIDENILTASTSQISKDNLDISYLEKFTSSVTEFLKRQVDLQIQKDVEKKYSTLETEKQQQHNYLNQKLKNFLGQEETLKKIENYINDDNDKPLIICGQSGIGKSSIMAKAIEDTSISTDKKIIYRFVGATPNSTNTRALLTSILEELNITIEDENVANENQFLTDIDKEENHFVNFSHKVYDEIMGLKDDIVIFIDAVDQLSNDDQFLWLPNKLPSNIKIVISALRDKNYKEDSKYFYTLENKITSYIEIEPFNKPLELLESLLKLQKRTLQDEQKEYFLKQYHHVNTPLYVYMAANEMPYWKSTDKAGNDITLSLSQKDMVKDFIEGLNTIHHHDKLLVRKVFRYILASKDGLSEYEILELLNTDKEFIKQLAPDTWHTNTTQELPLVIWTRLYNHIKPFLSRKNQDGQELLYFFHREFLDAVQNQSIQQDEHENIIKATQKMIEINQDKEFNSNRWGKLYVKLLGEYYLQFDNENKIIKFCQNTNDINNESWLTSFIDSFQEKGWRLNTYNKFNEALAYRKLTYLILEILNSKSNKWLYLYVQSLHNLSSTLYRKNKIKEAINIEEKNIKVIEKLSEADRLNSIEFIKSNLDYENEITNESDLKELASMMWTDSYLKILSVLSSSYSMDNKIDEAVRIDEKSLEISKSLLLKSDPFWIKPYLTSVINLSESYNQTDNTKKAIIILEDALLLVENIYDEKSSFLAEDYVKILTNLSFFLEESAPRRSKKLIDKSKDIASKLYLQNPNRYLGLEHTANINESSIDIGCGDKNNAKAEKLIFSPEEFKCEVTRLFEDYNNASRAENTKELLQSLIALDDFLKVCKIMCEKDIKWAVPYVDMLNKVAYIYTIHPTTQSGKKIRQYTNESLNVIKPLSKKYPDQWIPIYENVKRNKLDLQKMLYKKYIFGSIPFFIIILVLYFIFR